MSTGSVDLNAAPSWATVALAQLRMVALLQRREFLILGAIAAGLLALSVYGYTQMPSEFNQGRPETLTLLPGLGYPLAFIGAFWPLGVWRWDAPERRGYFWSLPVSRVTHTLLRVGIGWVLLLGVCLGAIVFALALIAPLLIRFDNFDVSLARWYVPFAVATLTYLLVSPLAVLFDSPLRLVAFSLLALFGLFVVSEATQLNALRTVVDGISRSFAVAISAPARAPLRWSTHYFGWFALGSVGLLIAAFRHQNAKA